MSLNRSLPRNVSFYEATSPDEALGGLVQNGSITEANFLDMLGILLVVGMSPIRVQERMSSHIVSRTEVPLQVGVYDIYCEASIQVSDEPWVHRLISHKISCREDSFRIDIRNRDRKCVISGISIPEIFIQSNNWTTFEAAHIFPPEHPSLWIQCDYGRWIAGKDGATESSKINSPRNGFLLRQEVHTMFDQYLISVNPDDGYKVVVFDPDLYGYDGKILDPVCRNPADPHSVSDELLRWHFRQSVLANVRGAGEPIFEHDFPSGTDILGEILAGPYARERFELEIAARLREVS
ncbi:HNH endonuclease-domain-containing protein [Tuber brumale]|nr:HNH endonuclease-domain-containing protein [Tuber brumale]